MPREARTKSKTGIYHVILRGANTFFMPIDEEATRRAAELRAQHNLTLPDAFQAAVAITAGCDGFLTNDSLLKRVSGLQVIVLEDLTP